MCHPTRPLPLLPAAIDSFRRLTHTRTHPPTHTHILTPCLVSRALTRDPRSASYPTSLPLRFNLINAVVGAGILSLPYAFSLTGWGGGLLVLLFNVVSSDYAIRLLLKGAEVRLRAGLHPCRGAAARARVSQPALFSLPHAPPKASQRRSYEGVAEASFGKAGVIVVSVCTILLNLGATIAYFVIIGDVLPELIHDADPHFLGESWARAWCTGTERPGAGGCAGAWRPPPVTPSSCRPTQVSLPWPCCCP